jgi:hypothetical protein
MNGQEALRGHLRHTGLVDQKAVATVVINRAKTGRAVATANAYEGGGTPANTIDGNDGTYWHNNSTALNSWLKVDLIDAHAIVAYRLYQYPTYWASSWKIQTSDDNSNWTDVETGATTSGTLDTGKVFWASGLTYIARYFRWVPLALNTTPYWLLLTVELWTA